METNKLISGIVAAAIAIIALAWVLMPVLTDATTTHETFTNEGVFYVEVDPTDTYTIKYDRSVESGVVYINNKAMDVPFTTGYTIMALDQSVLRLQSNDTTIQYKGNGSYLTGIVSLDITVSNGSVTGTYETFTTQSPRDWPETTYTECHIASPDKENYIMTEYNTVVKLKGDSDIFAFGQTSLSGTTTLVLVKITGTINDGVIVSVLDKTSGEEIEGAEVSDLAVNKTAVSDFKDLYNLTSITFKITLPDESNTSATYTAYIVPSEVTAERAQHLDPAMNTILSVIPILIIVSVLLGLVAIFIIRRE